MPEKRPNLLMRYLLRKQVAEIKGVVRDRTGGFVSKEAQQGVFDREAVEQASLYEVKLPPGATEAERQAWDEYRQSPRSTWLGSKVVAMVLSVFAPRPGERD